MVLSDMSCLIPGTPSAVSIVLVHDQWPILQTVFLSSPRSREIVVCPMWWFLFHHEILHVDLEVLKVNVLSKTFVPLFHFHHHTTPHFPPLPLQRFPTDPIQTMLSLLALSATAAAAVPQHITDTQTLLAGNPDIWRTRLMNAAQFTADASMAARFSAGFSDRAVLQRDKKVGVYGLPGSGWTTDASVTVTVTEDGQSSTYTSGVTNTTGLGEWKVYLPKHAAGGSVTLAVQCTSGCANTSTTTISDLTFGDVWLCSGQSNMELISMHTFERNNSLKAIEAGRYHNVRMYQHPHIASMTPQWVAEQKASASKPLEMQWNTAQMAHDIQVVVSDYRHPAANLSLLTQFSGLCWYFAQELTDIMLENDGEAVPIGLVDVAWGGTMIEQWTTNSTTAECKNCSVNAGSGMIYNGMVGPFANTTLAGFLWYQGENNIGHGTYDPSYDQNLGYACQMPKMIDLWRKTWSAEEGTTDMLAPFGLVDLASSQSEGHGGNGAMGNFRVAQTGGFGVLPNPAMPNTFIANAYDLGEPWDKNCAGAGCCSEWLWPWTDICLPQFRGEWVYDTTTWYMGPIHARPKFPLGSRLAKGAYNTYYNGTGPVSGPVISSCKVVDGGVEVFFNETLLKGDEVVVKSYNKSVKASSTEVLVNATLPVDGWKYESTEKWALVDIKQGSTAYSVIVDTTAVGSAGGVAYAYQDAKGCGSIDGTIEPCPPGSFPIMSKTHNLPAMPFIVRVADGQCGCISPQKC